MNKLSILYQSSDLYAPVAMVSMYSLLKNSQDINEIDVYLINSEISMENIKKFECIAEMFARSIVFIPADFIDKLLSDYSIEKWNGSYATFYKLFIIDYLNIDSILYIDSDTIIYHSLLDLCSFDFKNNLLGMAYSAMCKVVKNFYAVNKWYNAGVIYFNIAEWKKRKITEKIVAAITGKKRKSLTMVGDESLINALFSNDINKMSLEYNYESTWWLWGWNKRLYSKLGFDSNICNYYTPDEIAIAQKNPVISHYTALTTGRPWDKYNDNRVRKEFEQYYKELGLIQKLDFYRGKASKKSNMALFFMRAIRHMMPMWYRSEYGFRLHDEAWKRAIRDLEYAVNDCNRIGG